MEAADIHHTLLIAGWDVRLSAARNILHGDLFDGEVLMTIATVGALVAGEYPEAVAADVGVRIIATANTLSAPRAAWKNGTGRASRAERLHSRLYGEDGPRKGDVLKTLACLKRSL